MEGIGGQTEARAELVTGYAEKKRTMYHKVYFKTVKVRFALTMALTSAVHAVKKKTGPFTLYRLRWFDSAI
eukprot:5562435-Prymnesium_polylepis.1